MEPAERKQEERRWVGGGQMALWKRKTVAGRGWHLRESCLTLGRPCCPQRTKQDCLSLQLEQANPAQAAVIYHVAGNSLLLRSQAPRNPCPLSAVAARGPLVSKAPAWHPAKRQSREGLQQ